MFMPLNFAAIPMNFAADDGDGETISGTLHGTGKEVSLPNDKNTYTQHMWADINGSTSDAFCVQPEVYGPLEEDKSNQAAIKAADITNSVKNNNELLGVLYYGYEGPKSVVGKSDEDYLYTHIAACVATWDTNFEGMRDWQANGSHKGHITQSQINNWRNIPEVAKILNAAKGFNQDTLSKDGYTFTAYSAHGVDKSGKKLNDTQDLIIVKWNKKPSTPKPTPTKPTPKPTKPTPKPSKPWIGTTLVGSNGKQILAFNKTVTATDHVYYTSLPNKITKKWTIFIGI